MCDELALSRALGDRHLGRYIAPVAHFGVEQLDLADCPFFIVGCDGVWDVLSDQQAVDAVLAQGPDVARGAAALRDLAILHMTDDNVSAMVVDMTALVAPAA